MKFTVMYQAPNSYNNSPKSFVFLLFFFSVNKKSIVCCLGRMLKWNNHTRTKEATFFFSNISVNFWSINNVFEIISSPHRFKLFTLQSMTISFLNFHQSSHNRSQKTSDLSFRTIMTRMCENFNDYHCGKWFRWAEFKFRSRRLFSHSI